MTTQKNNCQNCNESQASFISRETKKSPPIFLCTVCAFKPKFLKWGIVSYHGNLQWPIKNLNKKTKNKPIDLHQSAISEKWDEEVTTENIDEEELKNTSKVKIRKSKPAKKIIRRKRKK